MRKLSFAASMGEIRAWDFLRKEEVKIEILKTERYIFSLRFSKILTQET